MQDPFKKQLLIRSAIVAGTVVVAGVVVFFLAANLAVAADAITANRQTIMSQAEQLATLENLKQNAPVAEKYQAAMDQLLASQDGLLIFPGQIAALGQTDGVTSDFSFASDITPSGADSPGSVGFSIDATGSVVNVIAFMKDLEVSAPVLLSQIDSFNLAGGQSGYTLTVEGKVFFK